MHNATNPKSLLYNKKTHTALLSYYNDTSKHIQTEMKISHIRLSDQAESLQLAMGITGCLMEVTGDVTKLSNSSNPFQNTWKYFLVN